ncbi:MAG: GGDEF domain-containing protein [Rhizobiaceae bacterium]|jgi:diguanylate cyclase (GGDEF)-like protein|nr:GGDEF domain-containing protein [Rhizobiaceae bacterium]
MRLHRSELSFLILIALNVCVALGLYVGLSSLGGLSGPNAAGILAQLNYILVGSLSILAAATLFGLAVVFPAIRHQVRKEDTLQNLTQSLEARSETLEHEALTDALTGMHNRRYFDDAVNEYLDQFRRIDKPVGLMILDLDHFKKVNDTYGHDVGDEVLRQVARCLQEFTRYHDVVARLGGEEFAIVAPNMNREGLFKLADRIRNAVSSLNIRSGNVHLRVTMSIGIAIWDHRETAEDLYKRADMQLYQAKRTGRNRVCAAA